MEPIELKSTSLNGNMKNMYYESILRKFLDMKISNPSKHKDKICEDIGVSPSTMNNILRDTGNGNMVRSHKVKRKTKKSEEVEVTPVLRRVRSKSREAIRGGISETDKDNAVRFTISS